MKKISVGVALLVVVISATLVMAGSKSRGPGWGMNPSVLSDLNLTTEQEEKAKALRESGIKEIAPLRVKSFTKRAELRLLWVQENLDADKIKAKQKEVHELQGKIQEKMTDFRLAFYNILTPEQRTQFLARRLGMDRGQHGGKGGHRGQHNMEAGPRW